MVPVFELWGFTLPAWGTLLVLGFGAAMAVAANRIGRLGIPPSEIFHIGAISFVAAVLGCKLWGQIEYGTGEMVSYGGYVAGSLSVIAYLRIRRYPVLAAGDAMAPTLALGAAVGRVGCFLNGCCYGRPCDPSLPWGIQITGPITLANGDRLMPLALEQFRPATMALDDPAFLHWLATTRFPPLHPTQLYAALGALALFFALDHLRSRTRYHGEVILALACGYAVKRLVVEAFRADTPARAWGLSTTQLAALASLAITVPLLARGRLRSRAEKSP